MTRPPRLPFLAVRALKACGELAWGIKAVWVEDWHLDQGPEGAWISAANLADRLGVSKDNVEQHRRLLRRVELYFVIERTGARSHGWVPTMPEVCIPRSPESIARCAAWLDEHIRGLLDGGISGLARLRGGPGPTTDGVAGSAIDGVAHHATQGVARSATRPVEGGRGEAPASPSSRGTYVPLPPVVEEGELLTQLGGGRRRESARGGRPQRADPQAILNRLLRAESGGA